MNFIIPHLWFDSQAKQATAFYTRIFPNSTVLHTAVIHDTPSGDCDTLHFSLNSIEFMAISAGPYFTLNPSISFMISAETEDEVNRLWAELIVDGTVMMPLDTYPFSKRYGWLNDRFGVSWQIMHNPNNPVQIITPCMLFTGAVVGRAKEALDFYCSVFPNSAMLDGHVSYYGENMEPNQPHYVNYARGTVNGSEIVVMDSALTHDFAFNEAVSYVVQCDTQAEIDTYWSLLSAVPEAEQCGWLKDKFGVSWQIVPRAMFAMMKTGTAKQVSNVTKAFLQMKKFDIATLEAAYQM